MKKATAVLCLILYFAVSHICAFAQSDPQSITPVEITGRHIVENNSDLKTGRHTFVLTASDSAPMPDGSEGSTKMITIDSNEDFSFGQISFDEPGVFYYTVSREILTSDELQQDDSVYHIMVEALTEGTTVLILEKEGDHGKPDKILYTDNYIPKESETDRASPGSGVRDGPGSPHRTSRGSPEPPRSIGSVVTGDDTPVILRIICLMMSMSVLLMLLLRKRRYHKLE